MSIKLERLSHTFVEEISKILMSEIKDNDLKFITITDAKISSDLSYAKIYYTTLNDDKKEEINKALNKASGFIRTKLCERVEIRKMPEVTFVYDESIERGSKVTEIITLLKVLSETFSNNPQIA